MQFNKFFLTIVAAVSLLGCKSRDFNSDLRGKIDNPDGRQTPCHETLQRNAPYTPELLTQQLTAALNQAATSKVFEPENFRDLLFSSEVDLAARGALKSELFLGDHCNLIRAINKSLTEPSHFYWLTGNGRTSFGGMALYKGDVFAEGFYRNRASGVEGSLFERKKYELEELMNKQPWFEWNAQTKKFSPRLGSPGARLVAHISADQGMNAVTLHRGTNVKYSDKMSALGTLNSFLFGKNLGGIFSTPDYDAAKGWSNPVVLSSRINPKTLLEALTPQKADSNKTATVYAGVEFDYVEVAFLYSAADKTNLFFDNVVSKCVVPEKAQGADSAYASSCK
ncbi:MAG: hypothetical protein RI932_1458 [Pseudomonadota bacterium]|jgi:hypothetical protein